MVKIKVKEVHCRQAICKSNLPESDFVINPYVGCTHGCIYCYARFMKKFSKHEEEWGQFLDVKTNAPSTIPFAGSKYEGKKIFMSSVTDPYLHVEKKYALTRKILEKLIPLQPDLSVQTKSHLILRDIDLFLQFSNCSAGVTITSAEGYLQREIEKYASSYSKRVEVLKEFKKRKINTHVFIGPIIPLFTDWKKIIQNTSEYTDFYYMENLNTKGSIRSDMINWIRNKHPDKSGKFIELIDNTGFWDSMEEEIKEFTYKNGIKTKICFHHDKK